MCPKSISFANDFDDIVPALQPGSEQTRHSLWGVIRVTASDTRQDVGQKMLFYSLDRDNHVRARPLRKYRSLF